MRKSDAGNGCTGRSNVTKLPILMSGVERDVISVSIKSNIKRTAKRSCGRISDRKPVGSYGCNRVFYYRNLTSLSFGPNDSNFLLSTDVLKECLISIL